MSAVGCGPLSYEWKKDGEEITHPECTGTKSDKLTISCFTNMHQGSYACVVKDNYKSLKSESASLALSESSFLTKACSLENFFMIKQISSS